MAAKRKREVEGCIQKSVLSEWGKKKRRKRKGNTPGLTSGSAWVFKRRPTPPSPTGNCVSPASSASPLQATGPGSMSQRFLHPLRFPLLLTLISPPPPLKYLPDPTSALPTAMLAPPSGFAPASSLLLQQDTAGHWPILQAAPFLAVPPYSPLPPATAPLCPTPFLSKIQSL